MAEPPHRWDVSVPEAIAIQRRLAPLAHAAPPIVIEDVRLVAGVDVSYADRARAAVVVYRYPEMERLEQATATRDEPFPYVPGLLSFREVPVALDALAKLRLRPDVVICDGQGYAHPRRFGLACHLGYVGDIPTIGCAKSRLVGIYREPDPEPGAREWMHVSGEVVGIALRTRRGARPLFISAGYRVTLEQAVEITLACLRGYRLPEPTRAADQLAAATRRAETAAAASAPLPPLR